MTESATQSFVKECFQATMEIWKDQTDYETKIDNLVKKYYVDTDVIIIRPSGNPIKANGFKSNKICIFVLWLYQNFKNDFNY